jgi:hypothetical protein
VADRQTIIARLEGLREGLLAVHKALLDLARAEYEGLHGPVAGPGALLQLLIQDEAFAWLHPISGLAARADELLEEPEIPVLEAAAVARAARELLAPDENGQGFPKRYFDALQSAPHVVLAHAQARRAIDALAGAGDS